MIPPLASLLWFYANNDTVVQSTPFTGQAAVLWVANANWSNLRVTSGKPSSIVTGNMRRGAVAESNMGAVAGFKQSLNPTVTEGAISAVVSPVTLYQVIDEDHGQLTSLSNLQSPGWAGADHPLCNTLTSCGCLEVTCRLFQQLPVVAVVTCLRSFFGHGCNCSSIALSSQLVLQ